LPADAEDWDDSVEADDEGEEPVDGAEESDVELVDPVFVGSAQATPGAVAIATPTPKATAKPPTRPTYFAYPITIPPQSGRETAASAVKHRRLCRRWQIR
jgi:hypothetical protein